MARGSVEIELSRGRSSLVAEITVIPTQPGSLQSARWVHTAKLKSKLVLTIEFIVLSGIQRLKRLALIQSGRSVVYNQHARVYTIEVWMTHQAETLAVHLDGQMESVMLLTGAAGGLAGVLTQLNKK